MSVDTGTRKGSDSALWETVKVILQALALALVVRYLFFQPFSIPSGSMKDNLLVGDYLFVSKYSYGYSKYSLPFSLNLFDGRVWSAPPERGDVAVFRLPRDPEIDYIKRVIGLPGDTIQMQDGVLYINGVAVPKKPTGTFFIDNDHEGRGQKIARYEETLPPSKLHPDGLKYIVLDSIDGGIADNIAPLKVPPDHYFMMGDNRDNSTDSRFLGQVGYVPFENFVGRAEVLFFSKTDDWAWYKPWEWPWSIRWSRFFNLVK